MADREVITRQQAYAKGLKRFYTGKACQAQHYSERYTCNGGCVDCMTFKTPGKRKGPRGTNVGWPSRGLVFQTPGVLPEEIAAVFLFIEAMGWLDAALQELRKRPELMERFAPLLTVQEQAKLQAALEQDRRTRAALRGETEN